MSGSGLFQPWVDIFFNNKVAMKCPLEKDIMKIQKGF